MKKLSNNVMVLGNDYYNFYLVGDQDAVLLECGTRAGASVFKEQWLKLEPKPQVKHIVILHSHFDHACGLPIMKELFPDAEVLGSAAAQKFLSKEKIVRDLYRSDAISSELYLRDGIIVEKPDTSELDFLAVDRVVVDGDVLNLSDGLQMKFLDAQGHSACSIAAYLENDQGMFVSDAAGYRVSKDEMDPVYFQSYQLYLSTLSKLASYPSKYVGVAHGEIPSGAEVAEFYAKALETAKDSYQFICSSLDDGMDEKELTQILYNRYVNGGLLYYPETMMKGSMYLLIKNAKEHKAAN